MRLGLSLHLCNISLRLRLHDGDFRSNLISQLLLGLGLLLLRGHLGLYQRLFSQITELHIYNLQRFAVCVGVRSIQLIVDFLPEFFSILSPISPKSILFESSDLRPRSGLNKRNVPHLVSFLILVVDLDQFVLLQLILYGH